MEVFWTVWTLFLCAGLAFAFVVLWRNQMVLDVRLRRIDEISKFAIDNNICEPYSTDDYGRMTYDAMLWDFRKWKYEHFYPRTVATCLATAERR